MEYIKDMSTTGINVTDHINKHPIWITERTGLQVSLQQGGYVQFVKMCKIVHSDFTAIQ